MTYRVGNHHGVTICAEPQDDGVVFCGREGHDCARGHLVAVVVNGDWELAEHICDRLNAATPDVDHTNGAREALAHVAERIANAADDFDTDAIRTLRIILESAAAELGVDEDAPSGPSSLPESDLPGSVVGQGAPEAFSGSEARTEIVHLIRDGFGTTACCYRVPSALPLMERLTLHPDAVTCGIVAREPERKPDDPPHPTCVETTRRGSPRREWVCGRDCDYREPERKADQA